MASDSRNIGVQARMIRLAPGFYTERDGGLWYVLTPSHDRLGEDFHEREDARRFVCFLAGEPAPEGWALARRTKSYCELTGVTRGPAILWLAEIEKSFPGSLSRLNWEG